MTVDDADVLTDGDRAALAISAVPVPHGFADRVLAARAAPSPARVVRPRRWVGVGVGAGVAAVVALVAVVWFWWPRDQSPHDGAGDLTARERTTHALGTRATVVAERGAELAWRIRDDQVSATQHRGDVFYRVDRSEAPFVVATPSGTVTVEGTCFRITIANESAVVTVYEGRVSLATTIGSLRLTAGERGVARSGSIPVREPVAAATTHTRELEALRARVRVLEARLPAAGPEGTPAFADPIRLAAMADECRIAWDTPPFEGDGELVTGAHAAALQISEADRQRLDRALTEQRARSLDGMRRLYVEATGDAEHADQLSWSAMLAEIDHKSNPVDLQRAFQRISAERAGFAKPPSSLGDTPPVERKYRLLVAIGDETEQLLATVLGATRARALRAMNGGWSMRSSASQGCPTD